MADDLSWKTAIRRSTLSAPLKRIDNILMAQRGISLQELIFDTETRCLDYGCGRGNDAEALGIDKWDPHWHPEKPDKLYDVVFCTYVLNVVSPEKVLEIVRDIESYIDGGCAYITVRRDIPQEGIERNGYKQHWVDLSHIPGWYSLYLKSGHYETYGYSVYGDFLET